ncbi:MAG: ROK family transcriptional regulator [Promicromonosporaceae bacterium]|nr:ROK family transcriptional regulator [Promicromonosporaceae bacterium]
MSSTATNHATLGATQLRILEILRSERRLSRVELAGHLGLTQAAVTNASRPLLDSGLVREGSRELLARGAPRRLLELVPTAWYALGVQFDLTSTTVLITDYTGTQVASAQFAGTGEAPPATFIAALADNIAYLLGRERIPTSRVLGVGLVTYSPQDRERGVLLTPHPTAEWHGFGLTQALAESLGLPVLLENDATAAAIGEHSVGLVDTPTFGLIYLATGIGGAVMVEGAAYRGRSSNAVEIDHIVVVPGGNRCECGSRGCVGAEAQPMEVASIASERPALAARLSLSGKHADALDDFERVARAAEDGDEEALQLLTSSADLLGMAAVTVCNLFDVDTLVLAGPALRHPGPLYRSRIEAAIQERAAGRALSLPRVLLSADVAGAAPLGGALHVLRSIAPRS